VERIKDLNLIFKAILFAIDKHEGQIRKDAERSPYITHPLLVAQALLEIGDVQDLPTLIAAILHDTLEDTKTTEVEIRKAFGEEILQIVLEVTDDKSLEKMARKRLQVVHAPSISNKAKVIKLSDKLVNCRDILNSPPEDWPMERRREYIQWAADVVENLRNINTPLELAFDQILSDAEESLDFKIKSYETINERPWAP
jgi:guanosine-3',5'-bis(diphosphate) 3'-pyrophosphohydrolase